MVLRFVPMRSSVVSLVALAALLAGCAGGPPAVGHPKDASAASGPVHAAAVDERSFGGSTYKLLLSGENSAERAGLLIGVTRHQLVRAEQRFQSGNPNAGLVAVGGAFLLGRTGELRPEMLEKGERALDAAATEVARVGNDGRALALYSMLLPRLPEGAWRSDVQSHLTAIDKFRQDTRGSGAVTTASAAARAAISRAIIDTRPEAMDGAKKTTITWLRQALSTNIGEAPIRSNQERDEAFEAYRALRAGGYTVAALYLRQRDPRGALSLLDSAGLEKLMPPELRDRLERAGDEGDPDAWADLYHFFESARGSSDGLLDLELVDAAAFGAAEGLFRAEPGSLRGALPMATELTSHGMAEVAPLVLGPALSEHPDPDAISTALGFVMRAVSEEEDAAGLTAARATFDNAAPLLELAAAPALRGRVRPTPARLRFTMAATEIRHGELDRARPLLLRSLKEEPSSDAYLLLVAIDRQRGKLSDALGWADKAVEAARAGADLLTEADAQITRFEIFREQHDATEAARALEAALTRVLLAQKQGRTGAMQARAERLLARVLEHYNDQRAIRRATERSFEAAGSDPRLLSATIMDAARRGLTLSDLSVARSAVERAVSAGMSGDDLVYPALWLQLLERKLRVPSSGAVEDAYSGIGDQSGWPSRLRAWATGRLSDAELLAAAKDRSQRTEAIFYAAMARHAQGSTEDAKAGFQQVVKSEAIDLVEVSIARDLLAAYESPQKDLKLPPNIVVP
jgi:tetratricopeptide (TPR) repeat protein